MSFYIFVCLTIIQMKTIKTRRQDKRVTTQMVLPLIYSGEEAKEYAKQHWNMTFARQKRISVCGKRIMARVLSMVKDDHDELLQYRMHVRDVTSPDMDMTSAYKEVKQAFDELTNLKWLIEDPENREFYYRHLIDTTDPETGYRDGEITIALNPILKPYFLALAHYTVFELKFYMHLKSWYSMRLFELLSAFRDTGVWRVPIEEYRQLMDCKDKYPNVTDLINRTTSEPLEELSSTSLAFEVTPIRETAGPKERGRPAITALEFRLKKVQLKKVPVEWLEFSDEYRLVLDKLIHNWKVSEANIVRYAQAITLAGTRKLLQEWELKERSNQRIDDKVKYCNAVWIRVGRQKLKELEQESHQAKEAVNELLGRVE